MKIIDELAGMFSGKTASPEPFVSMIPDVPDPKKELSDLRDMRDESYRAYHLHTPFTDYINRLHDDIREATCVRDHLEDKINSLFAPKTITHEKMMCAVNNAYLALLAISEEFRGHSRDFREIQKKVDAFVVETKLADTLKAQRFERYKKAKEDASHPYHSNPERYLESYSRDECLEAYARRTWSPTIDPAIRKAVEVRFGDEIGHYGSYVEHADSILANMKTLLAKFEEAGLDAGQRRIEAAEESFEEAARYSAVHNIGIVGIG